MEFTETYVDIFARLGDAGMAARLLGAVEAMRDRNAMPRSRVSADDLQGAVDTAQKLISKGDWDHHYNVGRNENVEDLVKKLHGL
jgi:hypothetical protein